jgi:hypothetical protein
MFPQKMKFFVLFVCFVVASAWVVASSGSALSRRHSSHELYVVGGRRSIPARSDCRRDLTTMVRPVEGNVNQNISE